MSDVLVVVEIGGTSVKIGFGIDGRPGEVTRTVPTSRIRTADPVTALACAIQEATVAAGLAPSAVVATVPGFLDRDFDTVLYAKNVPELDGHRLATELGTELGLPVRLERDVVLQLLGEATFGAVAGESEILGVYIGTGIGAAYLGREGIFRGGGWALELGHAPMRSRSAIDKPETLEFYASGGALAAIAAEHGVEVASVFHRPDLPGLTEALDTLVMDQAIALATAVAFFSPRHLLLGGGVVEMPGFPRLLLEQRIQQCPPVEGGIIAPNIVYTTLGWRAAIWGALAIGR